MSKNDARSPGAAIMGGNEVGGERADLMSGRLLMDASLKNGRLELVRGGRYGRVVRARTAKEIELDERMRRAFARCVGKDGKVPSRAVQEIREGRQAPWSKLAVRALEMNAAGVPVETIKAVIVGEMAAWLDETLRQPPRAA